MVINDALKQNKRVFIFLMSLLMIVYAVCSIFIVYNSTLLSSQTEWVRWQGSNEMDFSQISCFLPDSAGFTVNNISAFRNDIMKKLTEASIDASDRPFIDCWSCEGSAKVYSQRANGTAAVMAIGGNFFEFHPLRLLSGSYITENDVMKDRVILDSDLAWFLFGGTDLQGLTIKVDNMTLMIAGVVERETDLASRKAYSGSMGLFMSFETYEDLINSGSITTGSTSLVTAAEAAAAGKNVSQTSANISCYEICLPDPVRNFAINAVQEKFPLNGGVITQNKGRFGFPNLIRNVNSLSRRTMQDGVPRPYWENAALYLESSNALLFIAVILATFLPVNTFLTWLIRRALYRKERWENEYLPAFRENIEENIRIQQRRRWEKQYEKNTGHAPKDSYYRSDDSDDFNR